jgi:hypothetical protein
MNYPDSPEAGSGSRANQIGKSADCCAQRESAQSVLRGRADRLRRQAGELHNEANRLERLANASAGLQGEAEEALWALAINHGNSPRLF